jgi:hypothetical protein
MRRCIVATLALAAAPAWGQQNPLARGAWGAISSAPIDGAWYGTDLERRSSCTHPENQGAHGTYAEFDASTAPTTHTLVVNQLGITGLSCTYRGTYSGSGPSLAWNGDYSCTDGKHGTFSSRSILVSPNGLAIHLDVKLDTTETCDIDAVIGAGRFYP